VAESKAGAASEGSAAEGREYTEKGSVKETIENAKGLEPGNVSETVTVQSTTEVTPADADKSSYPNAQDAKSEDPPVRAAKPDTPIAQTLTAGAGEHTPPDPDEYDSEGRPREVSEA
jgi:hypothetical protein